jgi:hypothetical protein
LSPLVSIISLTTPQWKPWRENPKSQAPNPKQYQNAKGKMTGQNANSFLLSLDGRGER